MDKVVCFGKNYQDHMLELGDAPVAAPVIFLKPPSVLRQCLSWNDSLSVHLSNRETHYECELVFRLKCGGYQMTKAQAANAIDAYTIGLDMTLRLEQDKLKKAGHPWTTSKVFPDSCIIGPWIETSNLDFVDLEFEFILDGVLRQRSSGRQMLFSPTELIAYASNFFPLCAGDVLFTGTPAGVGIVNKGSVAVLNLDKYKYKVKWD